MFRQTPMILPGPEVAPDNSQTLDIMGRLSQQIGVNLKQRADRILIFEATSSPFKSDLGLVSAYPDF